jgi:hypothetical protein
VSPKYSSLAFDELKEQEFETLAMANFEPTLQVIINGRSLANSLSSAMTEHSDVVQIGGRITVSF